jgi:hypothetical protein
MSDEESRRSLLWQRRKWRQEWIARFAERQRIVKHWIALIDLVDWCAQSTTAANNEEEAQARGVAYRRLSESMRRGEFERDGRSKLLYLDTLVTSHDVSPRCRLTREQFETAFYAVAIPPASSLPLSVLNCCWLPGNMARLWLESHGYRWAPHFETAQERRRQDFGRAIGDLLAEHGDHGRGEKPRSSPPSREKAFWPTARVAGFKWLTENGCPAPMDGSQAELERWVTKWLEDRGHEASESAVRRHVVRWIKERRAELKA